MSSPGKTPKHVKLDERNHVEKPLLDQLAGLGREVIDAPRFLSSLPCSLV